MDYNGKSYADLPMEVIKEPDCVDCVDYASSTYTYIFVIELFQTDCTAYIWIFECI